MAKKIIIDQQTGSDITKGGVFFGSNLVPGGAFQNIPRYHTYIPSEQEEQSALFTLKKIKDSLKKQLEEEYNDSNFDDDVVEKFLYEFTTLLVDYRDMRNFVFFGSAHTEIAHNIKSIIAKYPYKTLVADLTDTFNGITLTQNSVDNETEIVFDADTILDAGNFVFYDDDENAAINWEDYDVVDVNDARYSIKKVLAPYDATTILNITNITAGANSILIQTNAPHGYSNGDTVDLHEIKGTLINPDEEIELNGTIYVIDNVTSNTFEIFEEITNDSVVLNFVYTSGGIVRQIPLTKNIGSLKYKVVVSGLLTDDQLINFDDETNVPYTGFIISPKKKIINDFEFNLNPVEKILLAPTPINTTPWPRRIVTNNIQNVIDEDNPSNSDEDFVEWLQNPNFLFVKNGSIIDDDVAFSGVEFEYRLTRALSLDETHSNQLIRRTIPHHVISEINDTEDGYFQRFILIAGWFFDQIYLYIKFLKYVHHLNYSDFNQLSPEYYKLYAEYYGFDLFSDDSIDFSKLVIKTEPGLTYAVTSNVDLNNKYYRFTLQQLQYERQKRLLLSLFYLYRTKGTPGTIKKLVSLLGAPEGLLVFNEFKHSITPLNNFDSFVGSTTGKKVIDNDKVHVPDVHFEIDPNYLINKSNPLDPVNQPYVYRLRLQNESQINLREVAIHTAPNAAIDSQIINFFGKQKYDYVKFRAGEFANLQNETGSYYAMPLSLPDKFFGNTITYMIPRGGYKKGVGNNLEECNVQLCSMHLLSATTFKPTVGITNVVLQNANTEAVITTAVPHQFQVGDKVMITDVNGITGINGIEFTIAEVTSSTTIKLEEGVFSGTYTSGGYVRGTVPLVINPGFVYGYPMPINFSNYNEESILTPGSANPGTDFNILDRYFPTVIDYSIERPYIIVRLEGNDLVIRLRMDNEPTFVGDIYRVMERVAIYRNIFTDDGLNHTLRIIYRPEGVEVYQDYKFKGLARWRNPVFNNSSVLYTAFEIPKKDILTSQIEPLDVSYFAPGTNSGGDKIRWWDMFVGMPNNIDIYFNKVEVFENNAVDTFNINDNITNSNNFNSDTYTFDFKYTAENSTTKHISTDCIFTKANPNVVEADYSYLLPTTSNSDDVTIVQNIKLTSKAAVDNQITKYYPNKIQNFFDRPNLFKGMAWQTDIHSTYEYENFFGKILDVYNLYSSQTLSYQSLLQFLDLIENKFKRTILQFIPIVINISEFGRLVKNSIFQQRKHRYTSVMRYCEGVYGESAASIATRVFATDQINPTDGLLVGDDITLKIDRPNPDPDLITLFTTTAQITPQTTIVRLAENFNNPTNNPYFPNVIASVVGNVFRIEVNYDWFATTFPGSDANDLVAILEDETGNTLSIDFTNGRPDVDSDCFKVTFEQPSPGIIKPIYIWYAIEGQPPIYLTYDAEGEPPIFIN